MQPFHRPPLLSVIIKGVIGRWPVVLAAMVVLITFAVVTPDGLLTKLDLVGYAVCHRIPSRSFAIAGRQLPLCARCTGTFVGALLSLAGQGFILRRHRAAAFPSPSVIIFMVGFFLIWACDGLNSYMTLVNGPHLYEPRNWLRLSTGALQGLVLGALVYPAFNLTLWRHPSNQCAIRNPAELGVLVLLEGCLVGLVLTQHRLLLYPLALLSAAGVLTMLSIVNATLALLIVHRENTADTWQDAIGPLLIGLTISIVQVGAIDLIRYSLTGTLQGIPPLH
jgi:Predicted membrane protein